MKHSSTKRGFDVVEFKDHYNSPCSLQKSSLADLDAVWLGVDDANPMIMTSDGWDVYDIPQEVQLTTRMHLTRDQVRELLPYLQAFVDTGEIQ